MVALALFVACYAGNLARPTLSPAALEVITSNWFRFLVIFVVAFLPKHNFHLALAIAIGFMVTSNVMTNYKLFEHFQNLPAEEDK